MNRPPHVGVFRCAALLVVLAVSTEVSADGVMLDRLFMTPADRARIDDARERGLEQPDGNPGDAATPSNRVVINGVVQRSAGNDTVWINGRAVDARQRESAAAMLLRGPDEAGAVIVGRADGRRTELRPGQAWDLNTGEVSDCVGCDVPAAAETGVEIDATAELEQ